MQCFELPTRVSEAGDGSSLGQTGWCCTCANYLYRGIRTACYNFTILRFSFSRCFPLKKDKLNFLTKSSQKICLSVSSDLPQKKDNGHFVSICREWTRNTAVIGREGASLVRGLMRRCRQQAAHLQLLSKVTKSLHCALLFPGTCHV